MGRPVSPEVVVVGVLSRDLLQVTPGVAEGIPKPVDTLSCHLLPQEDGEPPDAPPVPTGSGAGSMGRPSWSSRDRS